MHVQNIIWVKSNSKQFLETTTREIIANNTYINYHQRIISNNIYKLLSENHSKHLWKTTTKLLQTVQKIIRESFQTISTYILLSEKPFHSYKLLQKKWLQTKLTNYYQRIIPNNNDKFSPKKSLQTMLIKSYQKIQFILNNTCYL